MPFVAIHSESRRRVDVTSLANPRNDAPKGEYECPLCNGRMFLRVGYIKAAHFAHFAGECVTDIATHPESHEHLYAKRRIAEYLRRQPDTESVELEVIIESALRRADIMLTTTNGCRVAHEVQLSPITPQELEARTNDYAAQGIDTFWWLGEKADTDVNSRWCLLNTGAAGRIAFSYATDKVTLD
ncbi:MAG: competence protein CoiA family protein [Caldilineaceae bacterium]